MTPHKMRASRTTPLQHRGRNPDSVQAATTSKRHFYCNLHSQHWKPKSSLKVVSSFWTEKAISKYRPVATISKFEIVAHRPVVLVGECLPQTLLYVLRMFLSAPLYLQSPIKRNSSEIQRDLLPFFYLLRNFTETESEMHFIFRMHPLFVSCKFPIDFIRFCAPSCFTETLENII